jgi:hypothetical protein
MRLSCYLLGFRLFLYRLVVAQGQAAELRALNSLMVLVVIANLLFDYMALQLQNSSSCLICLLLFSSHDRAYSSFHWYYVYEAIACRQLFHVDVDVMDFGKEWWGG